MVWRKKIYSIFTLLGLLILSGCVQNTVASQYDIKLKTKTKELSFETDSATQAIMVTIDSRRYKAMSSEQGYYLSYHILDKDEKEILHDGIRTDIGEIAARGVKKVELLFDIPSDPGSYILEVDLVEEQVTWFSEQGMPTLKIPLTVLPSSQGK